MKQKSSGTAFALWLFTGLIGGHRFYVGHTGRGLLLMFTFGGFLILWILDLFKLGSMVEMYNLKQMAMNGGKGGDTHVVVNQSVGKHSKDEV